MDLSSEWSFQNAKILGEDASGPRLSLVLLTVSEALRFSSDLEGHSSVGLSLCASPDCELSSDELSLGFFHA